MSNVCICFYERSKYLRIKNRQGTVILVWNNLDEQVLACIQLGWIRERLISNFVQCLNRDSQKI